MDCRCRTSRRLLRMIVLEYVNNDRESSSFGVPWPAQTPATTQEAAEPIRKQRQPPVFESRLRHDAEDREAQLAHAELSQERGFERVSCRGLKSPSFAGLHAFAALCHFSNPFFAGHGCARC